MVWSLVTEHLSNQPLVSAFVYRYLQYLGDDSTPRPPSREQANVTSCANHLTHPKKSFFLYIPGCGRLCRHAVSSAVATGVAARVVVCPDAVPRTALGTLLVLRASAFEALECAVSGILGHERKVVGADLGRRARVTVHSVTRGKARAEPSGADARIALFERRWYASLAVIAW